MSLPSGRNEPIVVVGGGPVGLTAALLLAKQNVPSIVLERRLNRSAAPRAHVLNPRSLEIYRAFDFDVDAMVSHAAPLEDDGVSYFDWKTTGKRFGAIPFEQHDDTHTPHPRINLRQPQLERLLLNEARRSPLIDLRVGHRVVDLVSDEVTAATTVLDPDDASYRIDSDYVLACDGANSEARKLLGIGLHGQADVQPCLTIHFEADLRDVVGDRPGMFYWALGAKLPGIFIAYDIDKTWVYLSFMAPEVVPSAYEARAIVVDALGEDRPDIAIRHVIPWVMTAQVADRFRSGRVFLVGDAAHRFPPSGGLGLNTGIQDAHNLAWKIKAVRSGVAAPAILDTYERERQRVAEANTAQSLANAESALRVFQLTEDAPQQDADAAIAGMYDGLNSLALQIGFSYAETAAPHEGAQGYVPRAEPGDRMPHAWCTVDGQPRSTLDLLDPQGFTVLSRHKSWLKADLGDAPITAIAMAGDDEIPQWWIDLTGLAGRGALLVRPDGHILARCDDDGPTAVQHFKERLHSLLNG